eukprot:365382-Chlamydomonas_euryale.AAC.2
MRGRAWREEEMGSQLLSSVGRRCIWVGWWRWRTGAQKGRRGGGVSRDGVGLFRRCTDAHPARQV